MIELRKLTLENFKDFESLTHCESGGGCYCSFWHQRWSSMEAWENCKKETPEVNRGIVYEKVRSGFHVGALAYQNESCVGWISVGPLTDFFWTLKRLGSVSDDPNKTAGIVCITIAPTHRNQRLQLKLLLALKTYGGQQGWTAIEGYPFDPHAIKKHGKEVLWPGTTQSFELAGFKRAGPHWLSQESAPRSIYRLDVLP